MTCVVATVGKLGNIHMGSDSLASNSHTQTTMTTPKMFQIGEFLIGYSGSFRAAQLLEHAFYPPDRGELQEDMGYLCTTFVNAMRNAFIDGGLYNPHAGDEECLEGEFILGYRGKIYRMQNDFSILHAVDDFISIGSGAEAADAVLFATRNMDLHEYDRMELALESAAYHVTTVKAPFHFISMNEDGELFEMKREVALKRKTKKQ